MRTEWLLGGAVIMALLSGWAVHTYLIALAETEAVVVVRSDLDAGVRIEEAQVALVEHPSNAVHRDAVHELDGAVGRYLTRPVTAGQILLEPFLSTMEGRDQMLAELGARERAVRVGLERLTGVGQHLAAGDRIDLIFVGGDRFETAAQTLLQGVEILETEREEIRGQPERIAGLILRLDLTEAERLAYALERGSLRVVLNGYAAEATLTPGVGPGDLMMPASDWLDDPSLPPPDESWEVLEP